MTILQMCNGAPHEFLGYPLPRTEQGHFSQTAMISIIDNDEFMLDAVRNLVRSLGYRAAVFCSAEDYLRSDCLRESSCVITDLQMPGMNGADLQDRLIADGLRTPMIFMTAYFDERVQKRVMDAGAFGFLSKPFDDEILIKCIDEALKGSAVEPTEH
jgi:FixJ family two-component response regulator